jgi:GNAT superfamily N-acetyltransferase
VAETAAHPPATNLIAFAGHGVQPGTLLDAAGLRGRVTSTDQLGAIRWFPATGEVDQVYVDPAWRRRSVGNALINAASALTYAREWPRMWGDGQRTEIGEHFRNASPWRARTAELTDLAPPMTPDE